MSERLSKLQWIAVLVCVLVSSAVSVSSWGTEDDIVTFADLGLELAIRHAVGKMTGNIYGKDLLDLERLSLRSSGISDLRGIEYCADLTWLSLASNQITDLTPLSNLTRLTSLNLNYNRIVDLAPLSCLINLTVLALNDNQIVNLSPLASLTSLTELYLRSNSIIDLSPLSSLLNLTELSLTENSRITDLSPLSGLTNLETLGVCLSGITDLTPLSGLSSLTSLWLVHNQIADLSPLSGLSNLTALYLAMNQIADVSPLSGLSNLTTLDLTDNQIVDVSPLSGLLNLTTLDLIGNQVVELSPISSLLNLTALELSDNQIVDLSPLSGLSNLTTLDLTDNQIVDVSPFSGLLNLTTLDLKGNQVVELSPISSLLNLTALELSHNRIVDLNPVSGLAKLTHLSLSNNRIVNVDPLMRLTNLTSLYLRSNQIVDLSPLSNLVSLTDLDLSNNRIVNVDPLMRLTNLTSLYLRSNQIVDLSPLSNLVSLTDLDLSNNRIVDLSPLSGLLSLRDLDLSNNRIVEIEPLVRNPGIGGHTAVDLRGNYLDLASDDKVAIQALRSRDVDVLVEQEPDTSTEWHTRMLMSVSRWQAAVAYQRGRFIDAISSYDEALGYARELRDRYGEAEILQSLGACYLSLSDYGRAIGAYEHGLAIQHDLANHAGEASCLDGLGACYRSLSHFDRAIGFHQQSLAIDREIGNSAGEAVSLNNLGICYYRLSDYARAIGYHEQSLAVDREIGNSTGEAASLTNLGICYMAQSDYAQAIDYYEESLTIGFENDSPAGMAISLNNLGICYYRLSDYVQAIDYSEHALAFSAELGTLETERCAHWNLGRTYTVMDELETARTHYEAAIEIVETIRGTVGDEELRQSYFGSLRTLYEEYLKLLLETGRNEQTILVAERLRARTFLDTLYQSGLAPEQLQLSEAGIDRTGDEVLPVMDFEALKLAVEDAQHSLLPNEAVLEYMVGDDGIYLWVLTSEGILGPEFIPYDREQLLRDVVALRQEIEPQTKEVDGEPELFFSDPTESLGQFYQVLLQPALAQLDEAIDTLIFIPSGPLWYVPFAALVMTDQPEIQVGGSGFVSESRPTYLIDKYTLAFLPSLATLPMLSEADITSTGTYLALANPTLSEDQQAIVGPDYQYAVLETACLAFAATVGGEAADVYVKTDAREALATSSSTGQRVLMYACHGDFNPSVPLASRLLLSPSEEGSTLSTDQRLLDGDYHASEVLLTDHTGVDLVVLAACETLLPTLREIQGVLGIETDPDSDEQLSLEQLELIVAGDEVVGLSRAFLSSGAKSVLATLWQASPTAIGNLLVSFGEHSQANRTWSQALCQAQRKLIANESFDDVWFWAPYQLIGRWR